MRWMNIKGVGGVFWRTRDIDILKKWYKKVLNIEMEDWNGTVITPHSETSTIFSFFKENDDYFPINQQVMLNFQVENLEESIMHLEHINVPIVKEREDSKFGKFIWIEDPEGRRIEL